MVIEYVIVKIFIIEFILIRNNCVKIECLFMGNYI